MINGVIICFPHLLQMLPPPEFIEFRQKMWDRLKKEYDEWVSAQAPQSIQITLPDGKKVEGLSWRTTPYEVAKSIRYDIIPPIGLHHVCLIYCKPSVNIFAYYSVS